MAKPAMDYVPPPRESIKEAPANIEKPSSEETKYVNFRVTRAEFVEVKKAALDEGMTLGAYMMHVHRAYQSKKG